MNNLCNMNWASAADTAVARPCTFFDDIVFCYFSSKNSATALVDIFFAENRGRSFH